MSIVGNLRIETGVLAKVAAVSNRAQEDGRLLPLIRASLLITLMGSGKIRPIVDRVFPMEQALAAHRLVETEQRLGAVVIANGGDAGQSSAWPTRRPEHQRWLAGEFQNLRSRNQLVADIVQSGQTPLKH